MTEAAQILTEVRQLRAEVKRLNERIARRDRQEIEAKNEATWGTAYDVQKLTDWTGENLRKCRDEGIIKYKELYTAPNGNKVYRYNLKSIPKEYLKHS